VEYSIPAIRRLQLGRALRDLRKLAGLTIDQVGPDLDMSASSLNRVECGQGRIHPLIVRGALELFDTPFEQVEKIMELAREAYNNTWWVLQGIKADSYPALESEAVTVRNFELALIPGILQTEDYATALFMLDTARDRNRNLSIRMNRVARLSGDNPLTVHAVIDESALTRPIGGRPVLRAQLGHLAELCALPNITVQVLRAEVGAYLGLRGAFSVLSFPPGTIGDLAYIDHAAGNLQISKTDGVKELRLTFDCLATLALDRDESLAVIRELASD
jgi:transcriptional regulator with XRE-family HTH domain